MLRSIDLRLAERLKRKDFRREYFRAELEEDVPEQFRELRKRRALTQKQLAEIAEMKQSAVSRFERSTDANWELATLLRLADALDARLSVSLEAAEDVIREVEIIEVHSTQLQPSVVSLDREGKNKKPDESLPKAHENWRRVPLSYIQLGAGTKTTIEKQR